MTTNELAARVANLSRELTAAMETFPKLNPRQQTSLAIAGDGTIERLYEAWLKFTSQQWRERPDYAAQTYNPAAKGAEQP